MIHAFIYVLYLTSYKENVRVLKIIMYVNHAICWLLSVQVDVELCGTVHTVLCTQCFCYLTVTTHMWADGCGRKQKGGGQLIK